MLTLIQNGQMHTQPLQGSRTTGVNPASHTYQREARRHLFGKPSNGGIPTSLYQHVTRLVGQWLQHMMGKETGAQGLGLVADTTATSANPHGMREVRGIADRMPRLVDPNNPFPQRDSIFLGEARDYPVAVIAIQYEQTTKPVVYEGNQVIARHLYLDSTRPTLDGQLVLADGSRLSVHIRVIVAV